MMNIGFNPTVEGRHQTIEAHLFNFNDTLYGKKIAVELLYFLRDEKKFDSVDDLIVQLSLDKKSAISFIKNNPL